LVSVPPVQGEIQGSARLIAVTGQSRHFWGGLRVPVHCC